MSNSGVGASALLVIAALGLIVGVVAGLFVAWVLWPVEITNVDITDLKASSQDDYIILTASTYAYDQDLDKARARLALLKDPKAPGRVSNLARTLATNGQPEARFVAALAVALGDEDSELALLAATPTPTVTMTPEPTGTPSRTPSPTPTYTPTHTLTPTPSQTATRTPTLRPRATSTPRIPPIAGTQWIPAQSEWPGSVKYEPVNLASIAAGQKFWHLSKALYCYLYDAHDYCQNLPGGSSAPGIWVSLIGQSGARENAPLIVLRPDGATDIVEQKPQDDMCNCNYSFSANGWPVSVGGLPSDRISGMSLPQNYHVRYFITFQLTTRPP